MGTVYKKLVTRPLPACVQLFTESSKRFARWKPRRGRARVAPVSVASDGSLRLLVRASTYIAKYRDGTGRVVEKTTGCRDESAARAVLAERERRAELVRANVITAAQDAVADHQLIPLAQHLAEYVDHQQMRRLNQDRIACDKRRIEAIARDCRFARLCDLNASALERWLLGKLRDGMSPGNLNEYRGAINTFANWCVRKHRLAANPLAGVPRADTRVDRRRKRRALTEDEMLRLLDAAQRRPLLEGRTIRRGSRAGKLEAALRPGVAESLGLLGEERALIYKSLILTGLRKGELASLTVAQTVLDCETPHLWLGAGDAKNRRAARIPLRCDPAADLKGWLEKRLRAAQRQANQRCEPIPVRLAPDTALFDVPKGLTRILDRDLKLAGISKRDDRGRTVDVHALRHTFGTHLSKAGVAPRTAQAAMRHSTINLTMNVYTDPQLLDVAAAVEKLPALPLGGCARRDVAAGEVTSLSATTSPVRA